MSFLPSLAAGVSALLLLLAACRPSPPALPPGAEGLPIPLVRSAAKAPEEKLPPELRPSSSSSPTAGERFRALVDLEPRVDLHALAAELARRRLGKAERRRLAVAALERAAATAQARLDPVLSDLRRRGEVGRVEGFAVANRLLVEASREGLLALAARPEVAAVELETESQEVVWAAPAAGSARRPTGSSWAFAALRVEEVWAAGLDGRGVTVALLDSGASAAHEQLAPGFRGGEEGWYDPAGGSPVPRDGAWGHGSGVLSCAVGRNVAGITLGVAPGAEWAACAALPAGRFNNVLATRCADWVLRRARPDVVINAWQLPEPGCRPSFRPIVEAWRTAEILPVFAAGNRGPEPGSGRSPANYAGLAPDGAPALSVGGLAAPEALFRRSSRGPNPCGGAAFPRVTAPAVDVTAAFPLSAATYRQAEGTSFAAGLVAGVAALLIQRHPEAPVGEVEAALVAGAVDLGPEGPDPLFGHGRVDAAAALAWLDRKRGAGAVP